MADAQVGVEGGGDHSAECHDQSAPPAPGRGVVVCLACVRQARGSVISAQPGTFDAPMSDAESPRTLTPRNLQHRRRMLEWLKRA